MPEALTRHLQRAGVLLLCSCTLETLSILALSLLVEATQPDGIVGLFAPGFIQ